MSNPVKFILGVHGVPTPGEITCTNPIALPVGATTTIDLTAAQQGGGTGAGAGNVIDSLQSAFINNKGNAGALLITMSATGQVIEFPANSQGYLHLLQPNPVQLSIVNPGGGAAASIMLMNYLVPQIIWPAA